MLMTSVWCSLALNRFHTFSWCFHCSRWRSRYRLCRCSIYVGVPCNKQIIFVFVLGLRWFWCCCWGWNPGRVSQVEIVVFFVANYCSNILFIDFLLKISNQWCALCSYTRLSGVFLNFMFCLFVCCRSFYCKHAFNENRYFCRITAFCFPFKLSNFFSS